MRKWLGLTAATLMLLTISVPAFAATHEVVVKNFSFDPKDITIQTGDTVRWVWESGSHTVTSGTGPADPESGNLFNELSTSGNPTFEFIFNDAGTVPYYCIPHFAANMVGSVIVEEGVAVNPRTWGNLKTLFRNTAPLPDGLN